MHSTFSTRTINGYFEPSILWKNACNCVYTTCTYSGHCGNQFFFFICLRTTDKNADAESGPRPKLTHTHISYLSPLSRWLQCDVGDWMPVPVPGPRYDQNGEEKTATTNENRKIARAREMIISLFRMPYYCWHFFFSFLCTKFGRSADYVKFLAHKKRLFLCVFSSFALLFISYILYSTNPDQR